MEQNGLVATVDSMELPLLSFSRQLAEVAPIPALIWRW